MPTIHLKPKSPEFADQTHQSQEKCCAMPGCTRPAEHKAPKNRSLTEYLELCMDHAREYNQAWNYFGGMSDHEIYNYMYKSALWDRPTWSFKHNYSAFEEQLRNKAWRAERGLEDDEETFDKSDRNQHTITIDPNTPEGQALEIMELKPPLSLKDIKNRYKNLMKQHHPDLKKGDKESEELVKKINMAYTILKVSYQKYEKMAENF